MNKVKHRNKSYIKQAIWSVSRYLAQREQLKALVNILWWTDFKKDRTLLVDVYNYVQVGE